MPAGYPPTEAFGLVGSSREGGVLRNQDQIKYQQYLDRQFPGLSREGGVLRNQDQIKYQPF
jgi:hypothetical protein